jgi:hypothetical protein
MKIFLGLTPRKESLYRPKVVYGVDSLQERPVYAFYTEKSINAQEMKQQLGRSRKPKFIKFHFTHKKYIPNIITYKEHAAEVEEHEVSANNRFEVQHYSQDDAEIVSFTPCKIRI